MTRPTHPARAGRWLCVLLLVPLAAAPALLFAEPSQPVAAAKTLDASALKSTSFGLVPADVAFHYSSLRLREQFDWLVKSKAFAKIKALPMVKEAWAKFEKEWKEGKDFSPARRFLNVKENQQLVELVLEMVSDEIFITGGANVKDIIGLAAEAFGASQMAPLNALMHGQIDQDSQNKARVKALLDVVKEAAKSGKLQVPDLALGFKIKGKENAKAQLARAEALLTFAVNQVPELKGRLKKTESAGGDLLVFTLDGAMIPWQEIPFKEFEEDPGDFKDLVERLKKMKLCVSLGIKGDYIMLAVGASPKFVEGLGKGKTLAERDELKPLWAHADQPLTSLSYVSKEFAMMGAYDAAETAKAWEEMAKAYLPAAGVSEEQTAKIVKDLKQMAADREPFQNKPGVSFGCAYLTKNGQESWAWNAGAYPMADASKPLTLTSHLGGAPILAYVGRSKLTAESWASTVKMVKMAYGHAKEIGLPLLPDDAQTHIKEALEWFEPLVARMEKTTRTKLIPALADSQGAFVLDAKLKSKKWFGEMPEADEPLPAPELALVWGVSNAALLKSAMGEYRQAVNDGIEKVAALSGGMVPNFEIPEPETKSLSGGTAYFYPLPEQLDVLGIDKQFQPAAGLSEKTACLALSVKHVERLLKPTPLPYASGLPIDLSKPASSFFVFDHLALQDAAKPWLKYIVKQGLEQTHDMEKEKFKEYAPQVMTIIDCTRILRRHVSVSTQEKGMWVTHGFTEVKDIE